MRSIFIVLSLCFATVASANQITLLVQPGLSTSPVITLSRPFASKAISISSVNCPATVVALNGVSEIGYGSLRVQTQLGDLTIFETVSGLSRYWTAVQFTANSPYAAYCTFNISSFGPIPMPVPPMPTEEHTEEN